MTIFAISVAKATLLAAIIAAAAAVLKLVADAFAGRGAEVRAAHREILQPHLEELGTAIHEVVSGAVLIHRRAKAGQVPGASAEQAMRGVDTLKRKRLEVKYILDGLEEPLRVLTRAHDWTATYKGHESGDEFLSPSQSESGHRQVHRPLVSKRTPSGLVGTVEAEPPSQEVARDLGATFCPR